MSAAVEPAAVEEPLPEDRRGLRRAGRPRLAEKLAVQASEAADLRALATNPDVVALRVERIRRQVDVMAWSGIVLGLGFTMVNVQTFAARGAPPWSLPWCAAWLLDPMVSLFVIALLRTQQVCARWQVRPGPWVRRGVWAGLAATYAMNTWTAWMGLDPSLILLHSVPVVVVAMGAEALTDAREALTGAVLAAATARGVGGPPTAPPIGRPAAQAAAQPPSDPSALVGGARAERAAAVDESRPDGVALGVGVAASPATSPGPPTVGGRRRRLVGGPLAAPSRRPARPARRNADPTAAETLPAAQQASEAPALSGDEELVARLQRLVDEQGAVPSRDRVKAEFGVGSAVANRIRGQVRAPQPLASTNGTHQ